MSDPTRAQIEATVTLPRYEVEYWNGSAWTAIADDDVGSVTGLVDVGTGSSGLDFGASAAPRCTVVLRDTSALAALAWNGLRVRVRFGFGSSNLLVRWAGIVVDRSRSLADGALTWSCAGFDELIRQTPAYSALLFRRLPFTPTSVSSVEDPTNGAYAAGLGNYILWQAGGRPQEQAGTYPTAVFYYRCQSALIAPEWSWIAGEDGWQELDRLCRACGGQIVQQPDGTIDYLNPLAASPSGYAIDESDYLAIEERGQRGEYITAARCAFAGRRLQPAQTIYEDSQPRLIPASSTLTLTLDLERPVYDFVTTTPAGNTLPYDSIVATDLNGIPYTYPLVYASYSSRAAGRAIVQIANNNTFAVVVSRLRLQGRPIAVVEEGEEVYGSGSPEKQIGDRGGLYVQDRAHAQRLCRLYVDVYGGVRPARVLREMGYDPDRTLGEVVTLTCVAWGLSAVAHRIVAIDVRETGALMDLTVVPLDGIPAGTDLFIVGTTYASGDVRQLSW